MINVCDLPSCQAVYNDDKKMEEIKVKKLKYMCYHKYLSEKNIIDKKEEEKIRDSKILKNPKKR